MSREKIVWTNEKRKLSELIPAPYNPRQASEKEIKDLTSSLERFNLADPIIINKNNHVVGGHFRLRILTDRKAEEVDVRVPSRLLTEEEEKELNLRLNKNLGEWDYDQLANFDEDMLKDVGFDSKELDKIFQLEDKPEADDVPDIRQNTEWLMQIWKNGFEHSDSQSALLIWFASLKMRCILDAFEGAGWVARTLIVWNKLKAHYGGLGAQYKHRFEPLYYCYKNKQSPYFYGETNECTVWDCEQPHKNDLHPTMKPVELYERCVANHSKRDDIVLEFFGGSGTTLIACEKTNRKCRMMEIDCVYVDVIIRRWETFTGQKAIKL